MNVKERNDLLISWATISFAFTWIMWELGTGLPLVLALVVSFVSVGSGFITHELAHRYVAMRFGAHAEYRAWQTGLIFAAVSALMGFIFAAPGAVYIYGQRIGLRENGIISAAGPATNIGVALLFLGLVMFMGNGSVFALILVWAAQINFFLAAFNLIPFSPLDGYKVFIWNKALWFVMILFAGVWALRFGWMATLVGIL